MSLSETLDFLEPREGKAAAIFMSAIDLNKMKTVLEQACKILGSDCKREVKQTIASVQKVIDKVEHKKK